jgi:hypothetical protein
MLRKMLWYSDISCKRCLGQGAKQKKKSKGEEARGKRQRTEEIVCVREGFCTYAEVAIRMDYRRWAASVYKRQKKYV